MESDRKPEVHVNEEPFVSSPEEAREILVNRNPFHKFLRNPGFCVTTRNPPIVQLELDRDCHFWTQALLRPNKFTHLTRDMTLLCLQVFRLAWLLLFSTLNF